MTEEGLSSLRLKMPYADLASLECDRLLGNISDLFTVDLLVRFVLRKLRRQPMRSTFIL